MGLAINGDNESRYIDKKPWNLELNKAYRGPTSLHPRADQWKGNACCLGTELKHAGQWIHKEPHNQHLQEPPVLAGTRLTRTTAGQKARLVAHGCLRETLRKEVGSRAQWRYKSSCNWRFQEAPIFAWARPLKRHQPGLEREQRRVYLTYIKRRAVGLRQEENNMQVRSTPVREQFEK